MKKVKLKYLEKIYNDVHFIQTSSVILQNKIDDKKLIELYLSTMSRVQQFLTAKIIIWFLSVLI